VGPSLYQIDAQNWSFVVLNSLAKVNKNDVIIFEGLKISLKSLWSAFTTRATKSNGATAKAVTAMPFFSSSSFFPMGPFFSS
jgi:hypothetical protein